MSIVEYFNKLNKCAEVANEEILRGEPIDPVVRAFICMAKSIYIGIYLIIDDNTTYCKYVQYLMRFNSNAGDIKNFCKVHNLAMLIMRDMRDME